MRKQWRRIISLLLVVLLGMNSVCCNVQAKEGDGIETAGVLSMPVKPYSIHSADIMTENIKVSGIELSDAVVFNAGYGFSVTYSPQANWNFKGQYSSLTFKAGFYGGCQRDAKMTVIADGVKVYDEVEMSYSSAPKTYTVSLAGVHQLSIRFDSTGYDTAKYAVGDFALTAKPSMEVEKPLESNMFYSCEPYLLTSAEVVSGEFDMGGYTYVDGIHMKMGYGWNEKETAVVKFNFDNHYKSLSFDIGSYGDNIYYKRDAKLKIVADGVTLYEDEVLKWDGIPTKYTINLNGVTELEISTNSPGYDKVYYRLGNIRMKSDGKVRGITFKKTSVKVTPDEPQVQLEPVVIPNDANNQKYTLETASSITAVVDDQDVVTGRHKGTAVITATTDEGGFTGTCKVTSTLPAAKYVPSKHGWGFENERISLFRENSDGIFIDDYYETVYQRVSGAYPLYASESMIAGAKEVPNGPAFLWYTLSGMSATGGVCYGMSLTSALTYTGDIPFSTWSSWTQETKPKQPADVVATTMGDYKKLCLDKENGYSNSLDLYLKQFIFAANVSQANPGSIVNNWGTKNDIEEMIDAVKSFQTTGKNPIILKFTGGRGTHEVLPYEVIETKDAIDVYIYDSNLDEDPDDNKITFKKNTAGKITSWSYGSDYGSSNTKISYEDSLSTIADRLKGWNVLDKVSRLIGTNSKSFGIFKNGKEVLNYNKGIFSGDYSQNEIVPVEIGSASAESDYAQNALIYQLSDGNIKIVNYDTAGDVYFLMGYETSATIVEADGEATISTTATEDGDKLEVEPSNDGNVTVRYNNTDKEVVEVSGDSKGTVSVTKKEDTNEVVFTGYENAEVKVVEDGETKVNKLENITPEYNYTVSEKGEVIPELVPVEEITITGISNKIAAGKKVQLTANVSPANVESSEVTWKSSNTKVATVNEDGLVSVKKGTGKKTVTITATATDGSGVEGTYKITSMKNPVTKVKISGSSIVQAGKDILLTAKVSAKSGANKTLAWSSSNPEYATVSSKGTVTGKKAGIGETVKITAEATDGSGKKATYKVKIVEPVPQATLASVESDSYNSLKIAWNEVDDVDGYKLYVKSGKSSWKSVTSTSKTSYTHKKRTTGTEYSYKVCAYRKIDGKYVYGDYSEVLAAKPVPKQAEITSLTSKNGTATIKWSKVSGASGYKIYYKEVLEDDWTLLKSVKSSTTSTTHKKLEEGQTIYYTVRAYRTVSKKSIYGDYSEIMAITILNE